jgi:hypothetical protein
MSNQNMRETAVYFTNMFWKKNYEWLPENANPQEKIIRERIFEHISNNT